MSSPHSKRRARGGLRSQGLGSLALLQSALDAAPAHVALLDGRGRILLVNQPWREFARHNGAPAALQRGVGLNYYQACRQAAQAGDDSAGSALAGLQAVSARRAPCFELEYPCHSPDQQRWFHMRVLPSGRPPGRVLVLHYDVTKQKVAIAELERRRQSLQELVRTQTETLVRTKSRYREFLHMAPEGVARLELSQPLSCSLPLATQVHRILAGAYIAEGNDALAQQYGCASARELNGIKLTELMAQPRGQQRALIRQFITAGYRLREAETLDRRRDGSLFWNRSSVVGVIEQDCLVGAWLMQEDISERKRTEAALRESEALFRSLSDSSPLGIFLADRSGRPSYVNPRYRQILRISLADALSDRWADTILAADRVQMQAAWQRFVTAGGLYAPEARVPLPDGSVRWIRFRAAPLQDAQGVGLGYVGTVEDITERKSAEEAIRTLSGRLLLVQDEERRRLARELHDTTAQSLAALVMLLTAVGGNAGGLPEKDHRALREALQLAEQTTQELRTLSFLLPPTLLDEFGLAAALSWFIEGFQQRSRIAVTLDLPAGLGRWPQEVETAVFRVVQESLSNVQRHSGSRDAVVRLRVESPGLVVCIQDHGRGFDLAVMGQQRPPLGVGLQGMRERVRQLGGDLEINSSRRGTTVQARFPQPPVATPAS